MNVKLIRNALLTGAMCAVAAVLPAQKSEAGGCGPACVACFDNYADDYSACVTAAGPTACDEWWYNYVYPECLSYG